ncbi:hypothetical protein ACTI_28570 [Actinoplanes sp. OR16]|uniref:hypothetical protein n=1 Tax=Actinoplanes sp. OR16 TaxID=946334 RepID=UPI000F6BFCFC|nr:hypothetical protein [Actinoplanes sp. OR16]BBH66172.1 hypothetical protein ACTI_28570 [Actinoplanes sp. OR16]
MSDFTVSIERLLTQVHHWEERRWSQPAGPVTRAQAVFALAQQLADLGAEAEKTPAREVPFVHAMVLPDQLRVLAADIMAAGPPPELLTRATTAVTETRSAL